MKPRGKFQPDRPWQLPHIEDHDIFALQAVAKGIGSEAQQRRAYDYIVRVLCETERMTFWPARKTADAPPISPKGSVGSGCS